MYRWLHARVQLVRSLTSNRSWRWCCSGYHSSCSGFYTTALVAAYSSSHCCVSESLLAWRTDKRWAAERYRVSEGCVPRNRVRARERLAKKCLSYTPRDRQTEQPALNRRRWTHSFPRILYHLRLTTRYYAAASEACGLLWHGEAHSSVLCLKSGSLGPNGHKH